MVSSLLEADLGGHVLIVMTGRERRHLPDGPHARFRPQSADRRRDRPADRRAAPRDDGRCTDGAVRRRCDGVPLYIEEVVAKLKEQPSDAARSRLVCPTPSTRRCSRGCDPARCAAGGGGGGHHRQPDRHEPAALGRRPPTRTPRPGDRRTERRAGCSSRSMTDSWRFRHELLREVAAELSPPSVRRRLHSRIADALVAATDSGNPDWPLIARHYEHAERYAEAASAYRQASADARQRGALGEARTYLTHAVTQVERSRPGAAARPAGDRPAIATGVCLHQAAEGVSSPNAAADFERCLQLSSNDLRRRRILRDRDVRCTATTRCAPISTGPSGCVQSVRRSLTGQTRVVPAVQRRRIRHAGLVPRRLRQRT